MKILEKHLRKAIDELDKTLACMGLLIASMLAIWMTITIGLPIFAIVPILTFFTCAIYLFIRKNLSLSTTSFRVAS